MRPKVKLLIIGAEDKGDFFDNLYSKNKKSEPFEILRDIYFKKLFNFRSWISRIKVHRIW